MVHVPTATSVAVLPETVQTDVVVDEKLTGRPEDAVAASVKGALPNIKFESAPNVMVWLWGRPVPCSGMVWVEELTLSALSVKTAVLVREPTACGSKLMLRLQLAPGASGAAEKPVAQSSGLPEPATSTKLGPVTTRPGAAAVSGWLPTLVIVNVWGLSELVLPTLVLANDMLGGTSAKSIKNTVASAGSGKIRLPI